MKASVEEEVNVHRSEIEKNAFKLDWIEQGLTSPPTQYRLSGRQFYRSKDPTNSIKVLKERKFSS